MNPQQTITTRAGVKLEARISPHDTELELALESDLAKQCVLHWGLRKDQQESWSLPPRPSWPPGSVLAGQSALQTPFTRDNGHTHLTIALGPAADYTALEFVLFFPEQDRWDNNNGRNYQILLADPPPSPVSALRARNGTEEHLVERVFDLSGGGQLAAGVTKTADRYHVRLFSDRRSPLTLHWGLARRSPHEWSLPPENCRPQNTSLFEGKAAETDFCLQDRLNVLELEFAEPEAPLGIQFVLREGPGGGWLNYRGGNFYLPIQARRLAVGPADAGAHAQVAEEIVQAETTHNSWTLMHRFNLCYDLL